MSSELSLNETKKEWHGSLKAYIIGFAASFILTCTSFLLVVTNLLPGSYLPHALIGLALTQAVIQLIFFLHVGQEDKPKWETLTFAFMVLVLLVILIGTLWIMFDLDERVMSGMKEMMK